MPVERLRMSHCPGSRKEIGLYSREEVRTSDGGTEGAVSGSHEESDRHGIEGFYQSFCPFQHIGLLLAVNSERDHIGHNCTQNVVDSDVVVP